MNSRRSTSSPGRLAVCFGFLIGLAVSDGCGGSGGGCGGCGVSDQDFCANCFPGENVYGCDVPSSNSRVCAIDDATALGLCGAGSNAKLLAEYSNTPPGTGGQDGRGPDGAQGGTASAPPPVYLAIGVGLEGRKEVLGMWLEETEGARFWLKVITELKNRGVEDILIACVDGLL